MKVPVRWIQEIFPNKLSTEEIADRLTQLGLEVEEVEAIQQAFTGVVVGKVLSVAKHPEADRLSVAQVSDGKEQVQVVCGAPNCREGLTVAFAKVGAVLDLKEEKPFKIKRSKIRGVESFGMLCSEKELGLSDDHDKICELNPEIYLLGNDLSAYFLEEVLEVSLTPNLAHCFSILGVARELKASVGGSINVPQKTAQEIEKTAEEAISLQIADERCRSYFCKVIENVQVKESPDFIKKRLELLGQRPVNNIVDITNLVMFELGQPLHAFDLEKISGQKIILRTAAGSEKIKTLDGEERTLHSDDLLVCDERGPLALAGVMGGGESEVGDFTTSILLESAWFDPICVRKTSKRHALTTEASKRFERGIDPLYVEQALEYAAALIKQVAGGNVLKGVVKEQRISYTPKEVKLRVERLNKLLGVSLSVNEVRELLSRLDFALQQESEGVFSVTPPSYRADIHFEEDLIEEVARLYGYSNLALQKQAGSLGVQEHSHCAAYLVEKQARSRLLALGLTEFVTCDLIGPKLLEIVHGVAKEEKAMVKVLNPTSSEQSFLRTSLLPGILQVVKYNTDRRNLDIAGFEIGRTHYRSEETFKEETLAAVVFCGNTHPKHFSEKAAPVDFFTCKGVVEEFFDSLGAGDLRFESSLLPSFHPKQQARILVDGKEVGVIGALHPHVLRRLDVLQQIFYAEWNLAPFHTWIRQQKKMKPLPQFPGSERDWTVTTSVCFADIAKKIEKAPSKLLESFSLIDRYENKQKLGEGKANLTIRFFYRNKKRTLSQEEVEKEHQRILDFVQKLLAEEGICQ